MSRLPYLTLSLLLLSAPAPAQERHRAPPAKGHKKHKDKHHGKGEGHRKHRAPPAPEPDMPVRKPVELRSITPDQGPPGTIVSLDGSNFDDTVRVRFNGRWVKVVQRSNETIKVRIPRNAVTDRFVVSKAGFPDQTTDKEFGVIRTPVITGFDPRRGGPGTRVKITGQHFLPDDEFVVGPTPVTVIKRRHDRAVIRLVDGVSTGRIGVKRGGRVLAWSGAPFDVLAPPPVVADFSPPRGDRGTVVHVTGENFEPTDWVELNGRRLRTKSRGPRHIDVVIGNHTTGRFLVRGRAGRRALAANPFVVVRPPRIAGFSPRYGPPGTRLVIEGSGFVDGDQVYIGNAVLTVRTINDARIVAELPAGVTSGPVGVQRGTRRYAARGAFAVVHPPAITDFEPREAPHGARVTIRGRHFLPDASALLSGAKLPIVGRRLPNELVVQIPPGARTGQLVVVTRAGSARSTIPFRVSQFAVISSMFPLHGLPGTRVTLRGSHFHKGMRVMLNDLPLPVVELRPHSATLQIPDGARSGRINLDSHGRRTPTNLRFTVDEPKPEIEFTFTPMSGKRGSEVTLIVTPPRQVMVFYDGRPLPKRVFQGGRRLVVTVPGDARTGFFELELEGRRYRAKRPFRVR